MSFYFEHTYDLKSNPEMSAHEEQPTTASEWNAAEQISEAGLKFSPDLIQEKIKALSCQISALTQMMGRLIQDN